MKELFTTNYLVDKPFKKAVAVLAATAALAACTQPKEAAPTPTSETTTTTTTPETFTTTVTVEPVPETMPVTTPETPPPPVQTAIDCLVERCIALTFDDGPGPYTEQLLQRLAAHDAKATFFMVGNRVRQYDTVARGIRDGGHQLGNHSWSHDQLTAKGASAAADDIARTNAEIQDVTGVMPEVMRPPYGATNQSIINAVGMPEILWSVDPEDWKYRDSDYVANHVISHAERGDIVLMHDIHHTTVNAVPAILDELQAEGYKLVTIDTLLGSHLPAGKYSQQ